VLHSWAGSADMTKQLAKTEGVYFSISGHTFSLSDKKLMPMLQQVGEALPLRPIGLENCRYMRTSHEQGPSGSGALSLDFLHCIS